MADLAELYASVWLRRLLYRLNVSESTMYSVSPARQQSFFINMVLMQRVSTARLKTLLKISLRMSAL